MRGTLVPTLREHEVVFAAVCARSGASAASLAERLEAPVAGTDAYELVQSQDLDAIVIATPHSAHASLAAAALEQGKSVWVEKPLAVSWDQLGEVAARAQTGLLLVGHNRRFAPLAVTLGEALSGPLVIHIRVAAGPLAHGHWLEDPEEGGRVLGEISHFVDLAAFLAGGAPTSVSGALVPSSAGTESLAGLLRFADGSSATIAYGVGESRGLSKERIEVLGQNGAAVLDDFQRLELYGTREKTVKSRRDKGHHAAIAAFVEAASGRAELPVSVEEQLLVAAASLALLDSARSGSPVEVRLPA
jgi:predicted dehydrogenase